MQADNKKTNPRLRLSILVADDQVDTVLTLAELLRNEGHIVHTCTNASVVAKAVERFKPDICILDIVMPGKTGFAIAREVLALKLEHRPVLIAISGVFNSEADEIVATSAGFDYFIRKAGDPSELLGLLNRLAGGSPPPDAA
ncbi:MAG: response regulator [Burkholderiales bacterium]